jgi:hypothetical protein
MVRVLFPVKLAAMGRPAAVGAVVDDGSTLLVMIETYGAWSELSDCLGTGLERWNRRLRERVEEIVLGKDRFGSSSWRFRWLLFCPPKEWANGRNGQTWRAADKERETQHNLNAPQEGAGHVRSAMRRCYIKCIITSLATTTRRILRSTCSSILLNTSQVAESRGVCMDTLLAYLYS